MSKKKIKSVFLIAPSSTFKKREFFKGVKSLKENGLTPVFRKDIFNKNFNYAGTKERRADEIKEGLLSEHKIIMAVRGGYGATALIKELEGIIVSGEKLFIGSSDISAIHIYFDRYLPNLKLVLGPMLISDLANEIINRREFKRIVKSFSENKEIKVKLGFRDIIKKGQPISGKSFASCLTLLSLSIGTFYEPNLKNRVLFLEDVNEDSARILRFLEHLENSGKLNDLGGIIFNDFPHKIRGKKRDLIKRLKNFFKDKKYTVLYGGKFGHSIPRHYIPFRFFTEQKDNKIILTGNFKDER
jgi:muramoyltetrapeptide carboxypeptidase